MVIAFCFYTGLC